MFIIRKENGDVIEVTRQGLTDRLADPDTIGLVLGQLGSSNTLRFELTDGPAMIRRSPKPNQQLSLLHDSPTQMYSAQVEMHFLVPATIWCAGQSTTEAHEMIQDVVKQQRGMPPDFSLAFVPGVLDTIWQKLKDGDVSVFSGVNVRRWNQPVQAVTYDGAST